MPHRVFGEEPYRVPDLGDGDRTRFAELLSSTAGTGVTYGEATGDTPAPFRTMLRMEYVPHVADFEEKWHLFQREREIRQRREQLSCQWQDLVAEHAGELDTPVDAETALGLLTVLVNLARELAASGERAAFAEVAWYTADRLELTASDPALAALAWTERAAIVNAARTFSDRVTVLPVEIRRSQERFIELLPDIDPVMLGPVLDHTLHEWVALADDPANGTDRESLGRAIADAYGAASR